MTNFFDTLGDKISSTSKDVTKKAKNLTETMKLKSNISTEKNRIEQLFADLGKKYYELNAETSEADYVDIVETITAAKKRIGDYNEQINILKTVVDAETTNDVSDHLEEPLHKVCSNCGLVSADDAAFCAQCGNKLQN